MDPYTEQRLRDEVIYLHSLWHQGQSRPLPPVNLQPFNPLRFKKPKKKKPNPNPRKPAGNFSGKEWPVKPPPAAPPLTPSGWPELKLNPKPKPQPTPEQLEKHNWNQVQQRALTAAKEFYKQNGEDSDENDDVFEDDMSEDDDGDDDDVVDKLYEFVMKLFNEDEELKGYYLKHCGGGGEFLCLICGGANEKFGKRFKDCVALVQHSVSVAKTKKRRSHRAYGKVVCEVLGWEIDRLPSSIVLEQKCSGVQGNDGNVVKDVNDLNNVTDGGNLNGQTSDVTGCVNGESMVCEGISAVANVEGEDSKKLVLNETEGCAVGSVNNLCRNLSSTMVLEPVPVPCNLQTNCQSQES